MHGLLNVKLVRIAYWTCIPLF